MPKIKITITGEEVHSVGYRVMLLNGSLEIGIDYFNTFNISRGGLQAVIALIEGDEEQLKEVMDFVRTKRPEKAVVSEITDEEYGKTVPPIERCIQSFQMEQWGKGIPVLLEIRDILHSVKEDTGKMLEKQDAFKNTAEHGFSDLKDEHIRTREMSMEIFHSEVQELRQEINSLRSSMEEIKKKVGIA